MDDPYQLVEQLNSGGKIRFNAQKVLVEMGSGAVEALLATLNTLPIETPGFLYVLLILGQIKDDRVIPALVPLLSHPDERVQYGAARALALQGDLRAVPVLEALLKDRRKSDRWSVLLSALNSLGQRATIIAFASDVLKDAKLSGTDRENMLRSVSLWNDPDTGDLLVSLVKNRQGHHTDQTLPGMLARLKYLPAVDVLIESLSDDSAVWRSVVAEALAELGDQRAIEPLMALLTDNRPSRINGAREGPGPSVSEIARAAIEKLESGPAS